MSIKAVTSKDLSQCSLVCIQQTSEMLHLKVFSLLLLGSCGVLFVCAEPVASADKSVEDDAAVTLSTELQPPPLPADGEHHGIVYLINLFAVRNKTDGILEGKEENVLPDDSPRIVGPLASILLVFEDDDVDKEKISPDDLMKELLDDDLKVEDVSLEGKTMAVEAESTISEESNAANDKPRKLKKTRRKRTLSHCKTCGGGGGGGGYGGGQQAGVLPILVIPIEITGGGGRGHGGRGGHGDRGGYGPPQHGGGGGGGNVYWPNNGGYPNGGGYPGAGGWGNGGGGGGNSYSESSSQAQAQSQARSYNYGR